MTGQFHQRVDRALLIGIDRYDYLHPNLNGCVGDVQKITEFLVGTLNTRREQIRTLLSHLDGREHSEDRATRENIIAAFQELAKQTQEHDQVYIHYSGHGIRNDTTILPGIEPDGRDEGIAPADSGFKDPAAYYILDKELGYLIRLVTDKHAFVTMILDCCHSASGTRDVASPGSDPLPAVRRAWEGGDPRPRTNENLVAPLDALKSVVVACDGATGSLIPPPKNYVLLTACRENETAKEYDSNGVFTYFMLEHFNKSGIAGLTYRGIQGRVEGSVRKLASSNPWYDQQIPQLEGEGRLVVFGGGAVSESDTLVANPQADGTILIPGAGEAVGVVHGTTFGLYAPGTLDLSDPTHQFTVVTATKILTEAAVCNAPPNAPRNKLVPGMRALIVRPGVAMIRRRVALVGGAELDLLRKAITDGQGSPFLELVNVEGRPELTVVVDGGHYVVRDSQDQPLPRITPPLVVSSEDGQTDEKTANTVRQRLEHVVQYRNAWDLHNGDESSGLRKKLAVSIERAASHSAGRMRLSPGDRIKVFLHNRSGDEVSAALLYFSPSWEVKRIWPAGANAFTLLGPTGDPGLEVQTMDVLLPADQTFAIERFKLFATHKDRPTSFDRLRLETLDISRAQTRDGLLPPQNALEALLESVASGSATRELVSVASTGDWGTAELELETRRTQ